MLIDYQLHSSLPILAQDLIDTLIALFTLPLAPARQGVLIKQGILRLFNWVHQISDPSTVMLSIGQKVTS